MIRERVSIRGVTRPLEPPEEIPALMLDKNEIGLIKEVSQARFCMCVLFGSLINSIFYLF
jgi:hypothetical protein